jgi:hypothetical protein
LRGRKYFYRPTPSGCAWEPFLAKRVVKPV